MSATAAALIETTQNHADAALDEATHLRRLLERQPSCLVRLGADGTFLAVNDAALGLLGADDLKQVLGTTLTDRIAPEHHELWRDFAIRVWTESSGSIECDMLDPGGTHRSIQLKGVALTDHPDGQRSLLVNIRDTSSSRRLEQALQDHDATRLRAEELAAELERVRASLAGREADLERLQTEHGAEREKLTAFGHEQQTARQQIERETQLALVALQNDLDRSLAEGRKLEAALADETAERAQLQAALKQKEAERQELEKQIEAEIEDSITLRQQAALAIEEARKGRDEAESALEQAQAEHEQLHAMSKQRDANRQKMLAEHATARIQAERMLAESVARHEDLSNTFAAQAAELQSAARHLESLAQRYIKPERTE